MVLPTLSLPKISALLFSLLLAGCATSVHQSQPSTEPQAFSGVPELKLRDAYKLPVGPKGLEPSEKLLGLAGKQVRVEAYQVLEEEPLPGLFMLSPIPVTLPEVADGPSDYLPPATLFVHLPENSTGKILAYRPGIWAVTGTLELGGLEEKNGRVSYARLKLKDMLSIQAPGNQPPAFLEENAVSLAHHH